jgi:hypothetical protein
MVEIVPIILPTMIRVGKRMGSVETGEPGATRFGFGCEVGGFPHAYSFVRYFHSAFKSGSVRAFHLRGPPASE